MKRKVLLLVLVMFLILTLSGCWIMPGSPAWMVVEDTVYNYWQAIINRQYVLAKLYCVTDGVWHNKVDEWEEYINTNSEDVCSMMMVYFDKFYKPTEVTGDTAVVYVRIIADKIVLPCNSDLHKKMDGMDIDVFEYETELIDRTYPSGYWALK